MEYQIPLARLVGPSYTIQEYAASDPKPSIAVVRILDFQMLPQQNPNRLEFYFNDINKTIDLSEYANGIDDLLLALAANSITYPDTVRMTPPYETPLSLNNDRDCYVIYVLSAKNWQFCHKKPPFSIGDITLTPRIYSEARRVSKAGVAEPGTVGGPDRYECKIAYFIAHGAKAVIENPTRYVHSLNIHVDFIYANSQGYDSYMPVDIDPDVRHPGGSGA